MRSGSSRSRGIKVNAPRVARKFRREVSDTVGTPLKRKQFIHSAIPLINGLIGADCGGSIRLPDCDFLGTHSRDVTSLLPLANLTIIARWWGNGVSPSAAALFDSERAHGGNRRGAICGNNGRKK